jgi:hypothetical protein
MWPYGCLGKTGWQIDGRHAELNPVAAKSVLERWYAGGHSTYFTAENSPKVFAQMYEDICAVSCVEGKGLNHG